MVNGNDKATRSKYGGLERRGGAADKMMFSGTESDRHLETDEKIPAGKSRDNRHFPRQAPRE
jgi:hypothetical protein